MALFSGQRIVIYGFVPNCTIATLKAVINDQEISTVVSTSDLTITSDEVLHRLTARAIIRDWEDGLLSEERLEHEISKRNAKNDIINLSTQYSIVTPFTSFVAIEKRDALEQELLREKRSDLEDVDDWQQYFAHVCEWDKEFTELDYIPDETAVGMETSEEESTESSSSAGEGEGWSDDVVDEEYCNSGVAPDDFMEELGGIKLSIMENCKNIEQKSDFSLRSPYLEAMSNMSTMYGVDGESNLRTDRRTDEVGDICGSFEEVYYRGSADNSSISSVTAECEKVSEPVEESNIIASPGGGGEVVLDEMSDLLDVAEAHNADYYMFSARKKSKKQKFVGVMVGGNLPVNARADSYVESSLPTDDAALPLHGRQTCLRTPLPEPQRLRSDKSSLAGASLQKKPPQASTDDELSETSFRGVALPVNQEQASLMIPPPLAAAAQPPSPPLIPPRSLQGQMYGLRGQVYSHELYCDAAPVKSRLSRSIPSLERRQIAAAAPLSPKQQAPMAKALDLSLKALREVPVPGTGLFTKFLGAPPSPPKSSQAGSEILESIVSRPLPPRPQRKSMFAARGAVHTDQLSADISEYRVQGAARVNQSLQPEMATAPPPPADQPQRRFLDHIETSPSKSSDEFSCTLTGTTFQSVDRSNLQQQQQQTSFPTGFVPHSGAPFSVAQSQLPGVFGSAPPSSQTDIRAPHRFTPSMSSQPVPAEPGAALSTGRQNVFFGGFGAARPLGDASNKISEVVPPPPPVFSLPGQGPRAAFAKSEASKAQFSVKSKFGAPDYIQDISQSPVRDKDTEKTRESKETEEVTGDSTHLQVSDSLTDQAKRGLSYTVSWRAVGNSLEDKAGRGARTKQTARKSTPLPAKKSAVLPASGKRHGSSRGLGSGLSQTVDEIDFGMITMSVCYDMNEERSPLLQSYEEPKLETLQSMESEGYSSDISTPVICVITGHPELSRELWDKVFELKKQVQDKLWIYWDLDATLGQHLCFDATICKNVLIDAGLKSLGMKVAERIQQLVATMIVVKFLIRFLVSSGLMKEECKVFDKDLQNKLYVGVTGAPTFMHQAVNFCKAVSDDHPLVCYNLELGKCWDDVIDKFLNTV